MTKRMMLTVLLGAGLFAGVAYAAPPTAEEINKVYDYFNNGKDGPVLLEATACLKIDKKPGEDKKSCVEPVTGSVAKKTAVHVWMRFFVPKGQKVDGLEVEFLLDGKTRETKELSIDIETGSSSYGSYKSVTASKAGVWEAKVNYKGQAMGPPVKFTVTE